MASFHLPPSMLPPQNGATTNTTITTAPQEAQPSTTTFTNETKTFLDSSFPSFSSLKSLPDVIESLKAKKAELISLSKEMENSGKIGQIHNEALHTRQQLTDIDETSANMAKSVQARLDGIDGVGVVLELRSLTSQLQQLEQARNYLLLLLTIHDLESQVKSILARITTIPTVTATSPPSPTSHSSSSPPSSLADTQLSETDGVHDALEPFLQLIKVQHVLEESTKGPLFLKDVLHVKIDALGYSILLRAKSAFKTCLNNLGWPSPITISKLDLRTTTRPSEPPLRRSSASDLNSDLLLLGRSFTDLLVMQSSLQNWHLNRCKHSDVSQLDQPEQPGKESLWVMDIMLEPIIKRFKYHFSGKKATNRLDKPEWPLHHANKIVQEHTAFLSLFIQNLLLEGGSRVDAKSEFIKGLVDAINEKFRRDFIAVLSDKHLLFHTVKELLSFEKLMRSVHAYPVKEDGGEYVPSSSPDLPTCLDVLEDDGVFYPWLQAEIELGKESLYAHISAPRSWEAEESDGNRAAKCAVMLLALLHSFTERFRYLKSPSHQLAFFRGTQLRLLEIFLKEVAVWREWKDWKDWREWWGSTSSATSARLEEMMNKWCIFANSLLLIRSAVKDWSEQMFFLLLYKIEREEAGDSVADDTPTTGTIFDPILQQYKSLQKQFVDALITNIATAFKRATTVYLKKRKIWSSAQDSTDISTELCVGLEDLAAGLRRGATGLAPRLFAKVWRGVTTALDTYVVASILPPSSHVFSIGGTDQFTRDMLALMLLFRSYTTHPENHFKCIKETIKILTLPRQEQKLLQARLEDGREKRDVLVQHGIHKLDYEETISICRLQVG